MQPEPAVLLAVLALPFAGAAVTPLVYRVLGERTAYFAAAVATACLALVLSQYGTHGTVSVDWIPQLGVELVLYLDGLAFLVSLLASGVGILVFTYSGGYMHGEPGQAKYYTTLLVFMGAMLGVALAADLVALFVFWELTSVSSFVLIGHYQRERSSLYASRKSMLITVTGGLFMLVGFLFLHGATGSYALFDTAASQGIISNAEAVRETLTEEGLLLPVVALVGVGAAAKSAQVPFHIWLPNAMEAPTPVSAFLHSATMVKAGVYLVGRFRPLFVPHGEEVYTAEVWLPLFVGLGLLTMTVAAMLAVSATDIKELLAYSTASHLGLIVAGFGFAVSYGGEAGAFHILNHASFKAALFLVAGIVAHEAGTRNIGDLSGLRDDLPVTAGIATVACLSMAGIPPFNGFYSKELLFEASWETAAHFGGLWYLLPAVAVFGSVFTFLYSIKFLSLFYGDRPDSIGEVHSPPLAMLAPAAVLGVAVLVISAVPNLAIEAIAGDAYAAVAPGDAHSFSVGIPTEATPYALMSLATILAGAALYPFYDRLHAAFARARAFPYTSPNAYYDGGLAALERASALVPSYIQTRMFRTYAASTLLAVCALSLGGYLVAGVVVPLPSGLDSLTLLGVIGGLPLVVVLVVALFGAAAVGVADSHVAGVLTLSILGFMVAIFYVLASAPDLALTQLLIETLVLLIFLLVLDKLPTWYGGLKMREAVPDALVAGVVGVTVTLTVLLTTSTVPSQNIASFFVERAPVPEDHGPVLFDSGGGGNVVNVILVDFRAFDTLGEITVVAMAALAVLTLIGMRNRGEDV